MWRNLPIFLQSFPARGVSDLAVVQGAGDDGDVPRQSADLAEVGKHLDRDCCGLGGGDRGGLERGTGIRRSHAWSEGALLTKAMRILADLLQQLLVRRQVGIREVELNLQCRQRAWRRSC